jgi:ATPase subunit of ABC transporter with duplicated ATPase domains
MPASLTLSGLSWSTPDGTPLFADITLSFGPGRTGLVGRNGCGKSTLLRLMAGDIEPATGSIARIGSIGWMRQDARRPSDRIAQVLGIESSLSCVERLLRGEGSAEDANAADWFLQDRLGDVLTRVGLPDLDPWQILGTLSGGQRTRLSLARVLLEAPDILLLDEPTNNLDADGRALVWNLLRDWRGCVILASHDRALLEHVDGIVEISNGTAAYFGGPWSGFAAARAAHLAAARSALDHAEQASRRADRAAQAQRERQARRDGRGRADRAKGDAPKMLLDARKDASERTAGRGNRIAQRRGAEVAQTLAEARAAVEVLTPLKIDLAAPAPAGTGTVLAFDAVTCDIGGRRVLGPLDLLVRGTERVAIIGPNGSGKTTLLQLAAGDRAPSCGTVRRSSGAIALLDQHVAFLRAGETLIEAMRRMNPDLPLNDCHAALARFAFRNAAAAKRCGTLSGGERMRAGLACVLCALVPPVLLLLDEPTNHLDIDSVEVLEAGLRSYRGALVVVSHDLEFLNQIGVQRDVSLA